MSSSATNDTAAKLRILGWNIAGGPSGTKLEWLRAREWDVAILLEVSTRGAGRLLAATEFVTRCVSQYRPRSSRRGRRMMVAVCARPGVELGDAYPPIGFAAVESFEDQCMAVDATSQGIPFTVVGFHAPNAAVRGQSSKELLFERLAAWLKGNDRDVFLGADMNCWATGVGPGNPDPKPHLWHQERFRAQDETHPLVDSYRKAGRVPAGAGRTDRVLDLCHRTQRHGSDGPHGPAFRARKRGRDRRRDRPHGERTGPLRSCRGLGGCRPSRRRRTGVTLAGDKRPAGEDVAEPRLAPRRPRRSEGTAPSISAL